MGEEHEEETNGTTLWEAAKSGDMGTVKHLVEGGANINEPSNTGSTPLMCAVRKSRFDVAEYLLEKGAKVDAPTNYGFTPLMWAVLNGNNMSIIRLLLEHGANINAKDKYSTTPLLRTLSGSGRPRTQQNKAKLLIEYGADINAKDSDGYTVLMAAARCCDLDFVKSLIEKGLDINAKTESGWTVLMDAAWGGNLDVAKFLVEKGLDVNAKTDDGSTVLMEAVGSWKGNLGVVKFLVEHGADVNAKDREGRTVFMEAVTRWTGLDVVKFLVDARLDVNAKNEDGETALMVVVRNYYLKLDLVKLLVENGADINAKNNAGETPLIILAAREKEDDEDDEDDEDGEDEDNYSGIVKLLLESGADVEAKDKDSTTPLIWAAVRGNLDVVKLLVEHGAKLDPKDNEDKTALMWAEENEHHDVAKFLREHGTKVAEDILEQPKDMGSEDIRDTKEHGYWWVNASTWKFSDFPIGGVQTYMLLSPTGRPHQVKRNFLNAKVGDIVFGYESSPTRKIVALCEISASVDRSEDEGRQNIQFKKLEDLAHPIALDTLKKTPGLSDMESLRTKGQGSFFKVTKEEYALLMELIRKPITTPDVPTFSHGKEPVAYWFLNANPDKWEFSNIPVGGIQNFGLRTETSKRKRPFSQNFLEAKVGDIVFGYQSSPRKKSTKTTPYRKIVAICEIQEQDRGKIQIKKTEDLVSHIDYSTLKSAPELKDMEFFKTNGRGTLFKLTKDQGNYILKIVREKNPKPSPLVKDPEPPSPLPPTIPYDRADFLKEVFMSAQQYDALKYLLESKKNVILKGVPGVGKTFAAKRLAYSMMGEKDDSRVEFVQFHQNYSYEDFMMGYKPSENEFKLELGIFYRFCRKAANQPGKDFFFIIDEINRGNMSKIFGELLVLIESDHRGDKTTLAYNGLPFSVPENLYIIGMMNTADRSLAMIDYALRRRFGFFEMEPSFDSEGFRRYQDGLSSSTFNALIDAIKKLNKKIIADKSLGKNFRIGHSYFCGWNKCTEGKMRAVVECEILQLLDEYCFDDDKKLEDLSGELRELFPNDKKSNDSL